MMNSARFQSIYSGLTIAAKKVFEAVPITEPWSTNQIHAELVRTGNGRDLRNTEGCLNSLVQSNVVYENKRGFFIRAPVRGKPIEEIIEQTESSPMATSAPAPALPAQVTPIDKLTSLSARLRTLAEDIDNVALDFTEQLTTSEQQNAKLRQLQALLKELA